MAYRAYMCHKSYRPTLFTFHVFKRGTTRRGIKIFFALAVSVESWSTEPIFTKNRAHFVCLRSTMGSAVKVDKGQKISEADFVRFAEKMRPRLFVSETFRPLEATVGK